MSSSARARIDEPPDSEERVRRRIAEALHDSVLQDLLCARQDVMAAIAMGGGVGPLLARADAGIADAVIGLRVAVGDLHPQTLARGGLDSAVEAVALAVSRRARFRVTTRVDPRAACPHGRLLLSLAREFLVNAEKHAGARDVALQIDRIYGLVRLVVRDDGAGFASDDDDGFHPGHLGLVSARERVEDAGGTLHVRSRPGAGTCVVVVIPSSPPHLPPA